VPVVNDAAIQIGLRRIAFWVPLVVCTWLALGDDVAKSVTSDQDVPLHLFAFVYLSAALSLAHMQARWGWVVFAMIGYGGALELVQYWLPHRDAEWKDFAVDVVGIVIGLVCYRLFGELLWRKLVVPPAAIFGKWLRRS